MLLDRFNMFRKSYTVCALVSASPHSRFICVCMRLLIHFAVNAFRYIFSQIDYFYLCIGHLYSDFFWVCNVKMALRSTSLHTYAHSKHRYNNKNNNNNYNNISFGMLVVASDGGAEAWINVFVLLSNASIFSTALNRWKCDTIWRMVD